MSPERGQHRSMPGSDRPPLAGFADGLLPAATAVCALALLFWATGTFFPTQLPAWASSARQITGMALMLTIVPAYLLAAIFISQRRSLALIEQLRPLLPDREDAELARESVRDALRRTWKLGTAVGIVFGLLNVDPITAVARGPALPITASISLGQMLLWWLIGLLLATRIASARAFGRLGESVSFELFRLDELRPLARAGIIDVVTIAGALLLTPLQSLDLEFRWYNYRFALLVALPAASFFLLAPLAAIRRRIKRERDSRLAAVGARLREQRDFRSAEALARIEALLAHRDRLRSTATNPLSTSLLSRVLLYLVLPPLAWAGAALVERMLEMALGA